MKLSDSHKIPQEKWDFKISDVLITAWSRVQVLPGPYEKRHPFGCLFCISGAFTPHPLRAAGSTGGSRRPAFPAAGRGCPLPRCPPRPAQGYGRSP